MSQILALSQPFESDACSGRGTCECHDFDEYAYCKCENGFTGDYCHVIDADYDGRADVVLSDDQGSKADLEGFGCSLEIQNDRGNIF